MLSAYMRFKYPNVIDAALAASAPIYMLTFEGSEREFFFSAVTEVIWLKLGEIYLFEFTGVSIKFEVDSWFEWSSQLHEQGFL